jgi:hypothetical protein
MQRVIHSGCSRSSCKFFIKAQPRGPSGNIAVLMVEDHGPGRFAYHQHPTWVCLTARRYIQGIPGFQQGVSRLRLPNPDHTPLFGLIPLENVVYMHRSFLNLVL